MSTPRPSVSPTELPTTILNAITQALSGLHYGQVTIIAQDGRVMQIDRTDRHRMTPPELSVQAHPQIH